MESRYIVYSNRWMDQGRLFLSRSLGSIPLVHFSFKALILRAQSARKMSILSPFLRVAGGGEA
jgi:hypothetical protein